MQFYQNLGLRMKILSGMALLLVGSLALGLFAISRIDVLSAAATNVSANVEALDPLAVMNGDGERLRSLTVQMLLVPPSGLPGLMSDCDDMRAEFAPRWSAYSQTMDPGDETNYANQFSDAFNSMSADETKIAGLMQSGNSGQAAAVLQDMKSAVGQFHVGMAGDLHYQHAQAVELAAAAEAARNNGVLSIGVGLGALALFTGAVTWLILLSIARPIVSMTDIMRRLARQDTSMAIEGAARRDEIGEMARAIAVFKTNAIERVRLEAEAKGFQASLDQKLQETQAAFESAGLAQKTVVEQLKTALSALAGGDLTTRIAQAVAAEYESLKFDFNAAMDSLQRTMVAVASNTHSVKTGASEINRACDDLSRRTEQQAAGLEETAAALDQITATVRTTASGAKTARDVVQDARNQADLSGQVVRDTIAAMSGIEESSRQIGNIIGVIDEIAFQTNLLALNAGVEAARAGDAGRGFAVVATEVRALAQRSATAAKEIKALISASSTQVETGVRLVGDTGTALAQIGGKVTTLNTLVVEIAAAAAEQAIGMAEINKAVNAMDQTTQKNAAMVEQSTAASHGLVQDAEALAQLVARFSVGAKTTPARRREPALT